MLLKAKLTLGVVAIAVLIMVSTITVVYVVLSNQNRQSINDSLAKTLNIARDDLLKRRAKIVKDIEQMLLVKKMGHNVDFFTKYGKMGISTLRTDFIDVTSAIKQNLVANSLWQSAVYDIDGHLLAFVRRSGKQKVKAGFVHMEEKKGDTVYLTETSDEAPPIRCPVDRKQHTSPVRF